MRPSLLKVDNYRGLKDLTIPLTGFTCLIGRNNSGKSSVLQCISLALSGTKLKSSDFYDQEAPVTITLEFQGVSEDDFNAVEDEQQRERFRSIVYSGGLTIVRKYEPHGGKVSLLTTRRLPKNDLLRKDGLTEIWAGTKHATLRAAVVAAIPELDSLLAVKPTQADVKSAVTLLVDDLKKADLVSELVPLPTGLDKSILPLLPEIIYIPAVKDVSDEIKTAESATFGKLLGILLAEIAEWTFALLSS